MHTVMLVEDDVKLAVVVRDYLQEYGYRVEIVKYGDFAAQRHFGSILKAVVVAQSQTHARKPRRST